MNKISEWISGTLEVIDHRSRRLLLMSTLLGFVWFGVEISFVYILQGFLLSLKLLSPEQLKVPSWFPVGLYQSTFLLIAFGILRSTVSYFKNYFSVVAQHSFIRSCREQLTDLGLDSKIFLSSAEYLTVFSERVNQSGIFILYVSLGLVTVSSVILFFLFGIFYAPKEMIFSLSLTVLIMAPIRKTIFKVEKVGRSLIHEWNQINEIVLSSKRNYFFLAVYDLIQYKKDEIKQSLKSYEGQYTSYASVSSFFSSIPLFVGVSVLSLCAYLSVEFFRTPGVKVLSFFYIFLRLVQGLSESNSIFASLRLTSPFFHDVKTILRKLKNEHGQKEEMNKQQDNFQLNEIEINFNQLGFAYPGGELLYEDLNLSVGKSDILIIKGASGTGKSTLLKLLLGLERPTKGNILINNVNVNDLASGWRNHLGYVGPDPYLIKGTVRENLLFGNMTLDFLGDVECWQALHLAGLAEEFRVSKISLDTLLSELSFLSTGQKQRLAIARAFIRKPSILIFDEATANLDLETERQIIESLIKLSSNLVTIIVTHKNSFDRVGTKFITIGN